jgi:transposase-like protein
MTDPSPFKWRHFRADIIRSAVRWYLRCALSYRDVEELLQHNPKRRKQGSHFSGEIRSRC